VVVHYLDILRPIIPAKADAELVIDPHALLAGSVAFQGLQSISGRCPHVVYANGKIELLQLAHCGTLKIHESLDSVQLEQALRIRAFERLDRHGE
jgi:hypothetical protein